MQLHTGASRAYLDSSIVDRVLAAVAEADRSGKLDLPPLHDASDLDALERVPQGTGASGGSCRGDSFGKNRQTGVVCEGE